MSPAKETTATSALETNESSPTSYYQKSADASNEEIPQNAGHATTDSVSGRYEMGNGDEDGEENLGEAIEAIEAKKKVWYAYLTTWDFWIVVILGFVSSSHQTLKYEAKNSIQQTSSGVV